MYILTFGYPIFDKQGKFLHFYKTEWKIYNFICKFWQKMWNASRFCVSSLRRGHANLLCIVPILVYVFRMEYTNCRSDFPIYTSSANFNPEWRQTLRKDARTWFKIMSHNNDHKTRSITDVLNIKFIFPFV